MNNLIEYLDETLKHLHFRLDAEKREKSDAIQIASTQGEILALLNLKIWALETKV